jgi:hypothetical protein
MYMELVHRRPKIHLDAFELKSELAVVNQQTVDLPRNRPQPCLEYDQKRGYSYKIMNEPL